MDRLLQGSRKRYHPENHRDYLGQEAGRDTQHEQVDPYPFAQARSRSTRCFHLAAECYVKKGLCEMVEGLEKCQEQGLVTALFIPIGTTAGSSF